MPPIRRKPSNYNPGSGGPDGRGWASDQTTAPSTTLDDVIASSVRRRGGLRDTYLDDADIREMNGLPPPSVNLSSLDADVEPEPDLASLSGIGPMGSVEPGRRGRGAGRVTKADINLEMELAKLREEKIGLEAARNAAQSQIDTLASGGLSNRERMDQLRGMIAAYSHPNDSQRRREWQSELEKLEKHAATITAATATLSESSALLAEIPKREAAAFQRRDFEAEAEMQQLRAGRRGQRADRLGEARTRLEKAIKGYNDSAGTDAEGYYKGEMADAQADLERLSARGGKRGKGKGEGETPVAAPSAASISPEARARMKDGGMTDAEIDEMAPFIAVEEPAPAAEIKPPLAVEPEATAPAPASALAPAIPGWDGKYDSFAPAPAPVPRKSVVGPAGAPRRAVLSVEPQPLDPPIAPAANPYSWGPRRSGLFDMGPTYRAEQQAESDRREEERRGPERAEMARRINAARAARRASGNQ